ncbi:MAG TPA: site-2 protease family protein [Anaeromyxobacter sp.]|nr:site-2 protease family protein [Anaeromyxobacter sp.]
MDVLEREVARARFPATNVLLFAATVVTTLWSGSNLATAPGAPGAAGTGPLEVARAVAAAAWAGLPFAGSLVAILLSHEMGHYLLARRHRVDTTLPFFIPFLPWSMGGIGTLGAVIRLRSPMPSRRATLEIGAAGPIAGFVVALPLLLWGFAHSKVVQLEAGAGGHAWLQSPLGLLLERLGVLAAPSGGASGYVFGDSLVTWAAERLTHGALPGGSDILLHPVGIAAWFGMYVTTLNLLPLGQLDGGHVLYALLGRERARAASRIASWGLFALGLTLSWTWFAWWLVTRLVVGTRHPPAMVEEPLTPGGKLVAILSLLLLALTFAPVPLSLG